MISRVQLPEYKPDQSNNSGVALVARNVFPATDGYRAVGAVVTVSDALDEGFQGGSSAIAADAEAYLLAGTASDLYRLNFDGSWTSLIGSLSISDRWKFAQFGNYTVAVNGAATLEVDLNTGTASAITDAPTGKTVAVVGDHVVIGQADGDIAKVQWSAFRDHTGWTDALDQAGSQPMQTGGVIQAIAGGEYGIILQRERIVRMTRTGDSLAPFQFDEISANFGCAAGNTVAQAGRTIFFRSDRGFMALDDGQVLKPIGSEKVDRTFDALVQRDALESIHTAVDPQNKLVMWLVPGTPGTLWIYNFELDRWSTAELNAKGLFPGFTTSVGLDDLPGLGFTNLDTMTVSLDDPRFSGGNPRLYLVSTDDKVGNLTGRNLAALFELGNSEFVPGRQARVRGVRPIWDGTSGISLTLNSKARLGDAGDDSTAATLRSTGMMPVRSKGRYISTTIEVAAETRWDYIQGLEFEFEVGGRR